VLVESPTYPNALDSFTAARRRCHRAVGDGWDAELVESTFRQAVPRLAYFTPTSTTRRGG
jgi:DNA-binding transcriptional MocR family regulator